MSAEAQTRTGQAEREWWLRLLRVLTAPTSVFVWVRDDSPEQIWATTTTARPDSAPARRSAGDGSTPNTTEVGAPPGIFSPSGV